MVRAVDYDHAHPGEALLIVEVSDASLRKDRRLKTEVYAKAGVPECWVVNLVDRVIEIYGEAAEATYGRMLAAHPGDTLRLHALPGVEIAVNDFLR